MSTAFDPSNAFRAAAANLADAAQTEKDIDQLIGWHERQMATHATAIATLNKARAHTKMVIAATHEEATSLKTLENHNDH